MDGEGNLRLQVIAPAKIRRGFEADSEDLGTAVVDHVIEVLEARKNDEGIVRVCFSHGGSDRRWMSMKAGDGTRLLQDAGDLEVTKHVGQQIVVVPELAEEYRVVAPVKVRHPALTFSHVLLLRLLSVVGCGNRSALRWRRTRRW